MGKQDVQTLSAGLQSGLVSVDEVGEILETSLKQNSDIDLTPEGQQTMQTLVAGLQSGKVTVTEFTAGLKELMKQESKADLNPEGKQTADSYKSGLDAGKEGVSSSARSQKQSVEETIKLGGDFTDGYMVGIEEQSKYAIKMAGDLATDSINTFDKTLGKNPFDLGSMTEVKRNINGLRPKMDHMVKSKMRVIHIVCI